MAQRMAIEMDQNGKLITPEGFDDTELRQLVDEAQDANSDLHAAEARLHLAVNKLRDLGASWTVVGTLIGMTRSGAQKKFGEQRQLAAINTETLAQAARQATMGWHTQDDFRVPGAPTGGQ